MITLNGERGLVRVESWDDVIEIPGFTASVDPRKDKLKAIIGKYTLSDRVPCGLITCRTPHNRGFVVSLEGNQVSNIGKDCGKTHFGVDFETMSRAFDRDVRMLDWRERITAFQSTIPGLLYRISDLRNASQGDWVYKTSQLFKSVNCPQLIKDVLIQLVRNRDGTLTQSRLETLAEAEAREAMSPADPMRSDDDDRSPRRRQVLEKIGVLEGWAILDPEMDLRSILIVEALPRLKTIEELIVSNLTERQLRDTVKWIDGTEAMLQKATDAISEGKKFLRQTNISQMRVLLFKPSDLQTFDKILRTLPL